MIGIDGFFDWAIRDPGPVGSVNGGRNGGKGIIPHSAEGHFASLEALHDFHYARATAPPGLRASWAATNLVDGRFVQHYSVWAQTWTSGSRYPNDNFFAFENEGIAGEPLTDAQVANIIRVGRELMALQGWTPRRPTDSSDKAASLYEHTEAVRFGSASTACPSGRIPWDVIVPALKQEDDMAAIQLIWNPDFGRLYVLGQGDPRWVIDPAAAADLQRAYGQPTVALSWGSLVALGAK